MSDVAFERYLEMFYIQGHTPVINNFGDLEWIWGDGAEIKADFSIRTEAEIRVAEAQGLAVQGDFYVSKKIKLDQSDVVRRVRDNRYFRISGLPDITPEQSTVQFQIYPAELTAPPR